MASSSSLPHLVNFLKSILSPAQYKDLITMLQESAPQEQTLDPELSRTPRKPASPSTLPAGPTQTPSQVPVGLGEILGEMEQAFAENKFPALSQDETNRLTSIFPTVPGKPTISSRIAAHQGRRLVAMVRERLKI